jgi:hypothetical protein
VAKKTLLDDIASRTPKAAPPIRKVLSMSLVQELEASGFISSYTTR